MQADRILCFCISKISENMLDPVDQGVSSESDETLPEGGSVCTLS